jgi:amino acid permease
VKVTRKRIDLKRQCTENVAAMNEKETYAATKERLVLTIVLTCLWFITALGVLSGVYGHYFFAIMYLVIFPVFLVLLWRELAEKNKMLSKRWVRYIQAVLVVITILLIALYYHLL